MIYYTVKWNTLVQLSFQTYDQSLINNIEHNVDCSKKLMSINDHSSNNMLYMLYYKYVSACVVYNIKSNVTIKFE